MRILFVEPRAPSEHVFSRVRIPRLGSILLGTILRDAGCEVRVLVEEISGAVSSADITWADAVCLSATTTTAPRAYGIGDLAGAAGKTVVYGGPHVTFLPEEALGRGGYVVRGEGEETVVELLAALRGEGGLAEIRGLSFLDGGQVRHNPPRPLLRDLDVLPIPDFSLVRGWDPRRGIVPVATSRGCPHSCRFCSVVEMFGRGYRTRSVDLVLEEVRRNGREARHLFFCDDNFFANPARAKELLRRLGAAGPPREWSTQVRAESAFDAEFLRLLRETNCYAVYVGFESANPAALRAYRKRQRVEQMREAIAAFQSAGIRIHGMFILGADQDTPASVAETVRFASAARLDSVQFLTLTPLPGTETFRELEEADRLLTRDWSLYDGAHAVFRPRNMTAEELQREWYRAYLSFYSRRSILGRLLALDLFYGYLRIHARGLLTRGRARMTAYRRGLQRDFLEQARSRFGAAWDRGRVRRVALLAGNAGADCRRFLAEFLTRLGVEVIESTEAKPDLVVLPVVSEEREGFGVHAWQQLRSTLDRLPAGLARVEMVIDLKRDSLYGACASLGTLFSRNMRRIRRAYEGASKASGPVPGFEPDAC